MDEAFELFLWGPGAHRVVRAFSARHLPPGVEVRAGSLGAVLRVSYSMTNEWMDALARRLDHARREGALGFGVTPERNLDTDALLREWAYSRRTASQAREATPRLDRASAEGAGRDGGDSGGADGGGGGGGDFGWFLAELVVELAKVAL